MNWPPTTAPRTGSRGREASRTLLVPTLPAPNEDDLTRGMLELIDLESALNRVVDPLFLDQTEFDKQFKDNALFRNFVRDLVKQLINNNHGGLP